MRDEFSKNLHPAGFDGYGTDGVGYQEAAIVSGAALGEVEGHHLTLVDVSEVVPAKARQHLESLAKEKCIEKHSVMIIQRRDP